MPEEHKKKSQGTVLLWPTWKIFFFGDEMAAGQIQKEIWSGPVSRSCDCDNWSIVGTSYWDSSHPSTRIWSGRHRSRLLCCFLYVYLRSVCRRGERLCRSTICKIHWALCRNGQFTFCRWGIVSDSRYREFCF